MRHYKIARGENFFPDSRGEFFQISRRFIPKHNKHASITHSEKMKNEKRIIFLLYISLAEFVSPLSGD
jgi:hypothetical protein